MWCIVNDRLPPDQINIVHLADVVRNLRYAPDVNHFEWSDKSKTFQATLMCMGFTAEQYMVDICNIEARMWFIAMFPAASERLVELSFSTDDCELEFSTIVTGLGFKSTLELVLGYLHSVDYLTFVRRSQDVLGLSLPKSSHSTYSYFRSLEDKDSSWNDGAAVRDSSVQELYVSSIVCSVSNLLGHTRPTPTRHHHDHRRGAKRGAADASASELPSIHE